MIHYYTGDGKGKTTAAFGLALRCAGQGGRVAVIQFLKSGNSGEIYALENLKKIVYFNRERPHKFYHQLDTAEKEEVKQEIYREYEMAAAILKQGDFQMLILDEIADAVSLGILREDMLLSLIKSAGDTELVLTGHTPLQFISEFSDYHTEFKCVKHPYQNGIGPRKGIEY